MSACEAHGRSSVGFGDQYSPIASRYFLTIAPVVDSVPRSCRRFLPLKWAFRCRLPHWACLSFPFAVRLIRLATLLLVLFFVATLAHSSRPGAGHGGGGWRRRRPLRAPNPRNEPRRKRAEPGLAPGSDERPL